jgi:recombination associated protein RdgC
MWFRNLLVYRLTQNIPFDVETLEAALAAKPARPCASQELSTYGFVAPFGKGEDAPLVHASQGFLLISTRKEERILPGSVVKDALKEKVDEIENEQMRKVYKKEREQLKDDIIQAFLPRAFIRKSGYLRRHRAGTRPDPGRRFQPQARRRPAFNTA